MNSIPFYYVEQKDVEGRELPSIKECLEPLRISQSDISTLPFTGNDTSAGCENELQAAVLGPKEHVDLPLYIKESSYFKNLIRNTASGDTSHDVKLRLEAYLENNPNNVWENSWVRFPVKLLHPVTRNILETDLLMDRNDPQLGVRSDTARFFITHEGETWLRIPISYLLKLALGDAISSMSSERISSRRVSRTGKRMMTHLLSDNTSPETFSFHVVNMEPGRKNGFALAKEAARRYLFTQLLISYANIKFELDKNNQKAAVFFSPHPPVRQRYLNEYVSDSFYRELFMSPCLSGWDKGEEKYRYMNLCHEVLSRSHLNAVMKMREASIITNNLVVLPNTSNISLANNGTHISLGSKKITGLLEDNSSGFSVRHEKYLGDLVGKIFEHFMPLFAGTYSAAPYRFDFQDFHPERVLGFLPHQLDYTHLRMLWRRWKKKSKNKFLGYRLTPFGPELLDRTLGKLLGLKGAFVPDFRLLDYPLALLSTEESASQNGLLGNDVKLKEDLHALGIFDKSMSLYLPFKLREFSVMGFSGFEARYYSLFENFSKDMARAADIQMLITALAFQYIAQGKINHRHIPDSRFVESERRQIFFGAATEIPTFFVHKKSSNIFLKQILAKTEGIRSSRRYSGYLRVKNIEYRKALIKLIKEEARDIIECMGLQEAVQDLEERIYDPLRNSAACKLTRGILNEIGSNDPFSLNAREFNRAAEKFYQNSLKEIHLIEAWDMVQEEIEDILSGNGPKPLEVYKAINVLLKGRDIVSFGEYLKRALLKNELELELISDLIRLIILLEDTESWDGRTQKGR